VLTDEQKHLLVSLIEKDEPLPVEYRRLLFGLDASEYVERTGVYSLEYKGKAREQDILADTPAAPLQEIRSFNADNPHAAPHADWRNLLIYGDNLLALKALYEDQRGPNRLGTRDKIKLIYIDPPFATRQDFMKDREKAYRDKLIGAQFIEFLRKRLVLLRDLLADDGSIYVHLDQKKGHYIKVVMDEVFGENNFVNEIIWQRSSSHNDAKRFGVIHDSIFVYGKSDDRVFRQVHTDYSQAYIEERFKNVEEATGRRFWLNTMTAAGQGAAKVFAGKRLDPPPGTHWRFGQKKIDQHVQDGKIVFSASGMPYVKQYLDESRGRPAQSIWIDVVPSKSGSELTGYPTQKPEDLLERVIRASTTDEDIVLDAFAGSGSTLVVAEKLQRRWIGIDCGRLAIYTAQKRLLNLTDQIGAEKKDERREHERVDDFTAHSKASSKAALLLFDKAKDGELEITDAFLTDFAKFLGANCPVRRGATPEFSLLCPEEKLVLRKLKRIEDEELKAGQFAVDAGGVRFLISFIEPRTKSELPKPLKARHFALFHAGVYERARIRELDWAAYKPFVMQLFGVRDDPHPIHAFHADGYIGTDSVHIWNYPDQKTLTLDEGYIESLHQTMRGHGGAKFYVIAPVSALDFMTDELRFGETRYIVLKVPESVLTRLLTSGQPGALKQPVSESEVNEVIDAVGFDFVSQPLTEQQFLSLPPPDADLTNQHQREAVVRLTQFRAKTLSTSPEDFANFETLSMAMVDPDFNGEVFSLGSVHWGEALVKAELKRLQDIGSEKANGPGDCERLDIRIPFESLGRKAMIILVDRYGNEKRLEIARGEFAEAQDKRKPARKPAKKAARKAARGRRK
jgi:DNA modification methylase